MITMARRKNTPSKEELFEQNLKDLLYETTEYLLNKVRESEAIASDISNIIKLLSATGVLQPVTQEDDENEGYTMTLPFPLDEE
jgi:hypothetical protein